MHSEFVTYKPVVRFSGDDRLSHGSGPVRVIRLEGIDLSSPVEIPADETGVAELERIREKIRDGKAAAFILPANALHKQPREKHSGPRPDAAGCTVASDGLHAWMKNGFQLSGAQRWKCLKCKLSNSTGGEE
jgi:hypothetical protein